MTTFIGTEFLIGFGLIRKLRQGDDRISYAELRDMARQLQNKLNNSDVDAVVLTDFVGALNSYSDYFERCGEYHVKCAPGIGLYALRRRFIGYLPLDVLYAMMSEWLCDGKL